ncbi:MAG: hypothetical protein JTT16_04220, partial [Candidatus Brockarchaeota archaeon]|nr:hypothetical protein [Candidatus Brockarchaeota archaeon]
MVYKIGIVGSDNSHAIVLSQIANGVDKENYVPEFKVTHLFGLDDKRNKEVAEKGKIENIVSDVSEMIGKIDIAFIEFRHGGLHLEYAKHFIESSFGKTLLVGAKLIDAVGKLKDYNIVSGFAGSVYMDI